LQLHKSIVVFSQKGVFMATQELVKEFEQQVPQMLSTSSTSLRNGYSLVQCLEMLEQNSAEPVANEFRQLIAEVKSGTNLSQALDNWRGRLPSEDLNIIVATIKVQIANGGNLADKFDLIRQVIEQRQR
jgi:tight adherence protein B